MTAPVPAERSQQLPAGTGALGLFWLIGSLGMLFVATLVSLWVVRGGMDLSQLDPQPEALPLGVWLATVVLVVLSLAAERAARDSGTPRGALALTGICSLLFLGLQVGNWAALHQGGFPATSGLYAFGFFVLTGLHAAHVIGGVVYQWRTIREPANRERRRAAAIYWHFLFLTWLLILGTIEGTASESGPLYVGWFFYGIGWASLGLGILCWLQTVRLIWTKDGVGFGLLGLFPLFSVVFGWVRFQEHDNLRVMVAWQICIALGMLSWIMSANLLVG